MSKNKAVLVISDTHFPYNHVDVIPFLRALKKKYKFDLVVHIGDEVDYHAISFHDSDPDLLSPGDELQAAIRRLKPLYKLFPEVHVIESNHGSLVYRKGKAMGLPRSVLRSYRDILEAPKGWQWHFDLKIRLSNGQDCYFHHSKGSNILGVSQAMGCNVVSGHEHSSFEIRYWGNSYALMWGLRVGCLIEDSSLAFAYNRTTLKRPVIGCAGILNGLPRLFPMVLLKNGRWDKSIP